MRFRDNMTREAQLAGYGMIPPLSITTFVSINIVRAAIPSSMKRSLYSTNFLGNILG